MADFKTHITASTLLGVGYGTAGYLFYDLPLPTCILAGAFCGVAGMLPDIDSDSGVPLRESLGFAAAIVPIMLIDRMRQLDMSPESIVLGGGLLYLLIRFGVGAIMRRCTVHRGMFHSLPAALIFGELAFLLAFGPSTAIRLYKAGGVVAGYLSHLLLDELYSIEWYHGHLRLKQSFGTAMKLVGKTWWANVSTYAKLAIITFLVMREPVWTHDVSGQGPGQSPRQETAQKVEASSGAPKPSRATRLLEEARNLFR